MKMLVVETKLVAQKQELGIKLRADVVYRFGNTDNFYLGFKYNSASGKLSNADANKVKVNRIETGLGWFMTKNVMSKLIYVNQDYKDYPSASNFAGANFKGLLLKQ